MFVPNNVKWKEFVSELNSTFGKDSTLENYSLRVKDNGFSFSLQYEGLKELYLKVRYSEEGILTDYRLKYDDELVAELSIHDIGPTIILIILILIVVSVAILGIFILKKHISKTDVAPAQDTIKFKCIRIIQEEDIPPSLRNFIAQQKEGSIIRPENLPKKYKERGIEYCRFETENNKLVLKCYSRVKDL